MRSRLVTAMAALPLLVAAPAFAQVPNPTQMLQGLLSGNQNQDQAVRDAFERGYRRGREDQLRADRDRGSPPLDRRSYQDQGRLYPDPNPSDQRGSYSR